MSASLEQIQDALGLIKEQQAVQSQILNTIVQRMDQSTAALTLQSAQISNLVTQVEVLKSENMTHRNEVNTRLNQLSAWQNDALNVFVSRKEQEAMKLDARVMKLEERLDQDQKESKNTVLQVIFNLLPIFIAIATFALVYFRP